MNTKAGILRICQPIFKWAWLPGKRSCHHGDGSEPWFYVHLEWAGGEERWGQERWAAGQWNTAVLCSLSCFSLPLFFSLLLAHSGSLTWLEARVQQLSNPNATKAGFAFHTADFCTSKVSVSAFKNTLFKLQIWKRKWYWKRSSWMTWLHNVDICCWYSTGFSSNWRSAANW